MNNRDHRDDADPDRAKHDSATATPTEPKPCDCDDARDQTHRNGALEVDFMNRQHWLSHLSFDAELARHKPVGGRDQAVHDFTIHVTADVFDRRDIVNRNRREQQRHSQQHGLNGNALAMQNREHLSAAR